MNVVWALANSGLTDAQLERAAIQEFVRSWKEYGAPYPLEMELESVFEPRTPAIAAEMIISYVEERRAWIAEGELIAVEQPFVVELGIEPQYIGRLDKVFRPKGKRIRAIEHKSTAWYRKEGGFRVDWIDQWDLNSQIDGYMHSGNMLYGDEFEGVTIDGALIHKTVRKFKLLPIHKQFALVDQWLWEAQDWISRIETEKESLLIEEALEQPNYMGFPKNTGSCFTFGRRCPYFDICRFRADPVHDTGVPDGFKIEKWEPFEILKIGQIVEKADA